LETKRNPVFFPKDFWTKQEHLRSRMSDGVLQSRASSLAKGFGSTAPAWLAQAQPCSFIRVNPAHPWFKIQRTTRFHSSLAFLKLINRPKSSPVIAK
jgi:hypothetical protein